MFRKWRFLFQNRPKNQISLKKNTPKKKKVQNFFLTFNKKNFKSLKYSHIFLKFHTKTPEKRLNFDKKLQKKEIIFKFCLKSTKNPKDKNIYIFFLDFHKKITPEERNFQIYLKIMRKNSKIKKFYHNRVQIYVVYDEFFHFKPFATMGGLVNGSHSYCFVGIQIFA